MEFKKIKDEPTKEELLFIVGNDNKTFWKLMEEIRSKGKAIDGEWEGGTSACFVNTYEYGNYIYEISIDWDLGIPHKITRKEK